MEDETKGLSLKAIGLLVVMNKYPGISREILLEDYHDGDFSLRAAYKELKEARLISRSFNGYYVIKEDASLNPTPSSDPIVNKPIKKIKKLKKVKKLKNMKITSALKFYDDEMDSAHGHEFEGEYWQFIEYLKGANAREVQLNHILKLGEPITFKNFCKIKGKAIDKGKSLGNIMDEIANSPKYTEEYVNLYLILDTWVNKT
jgi:hypothetical protein